jgi:hypothetical protein
MTGSGYYNSVYKDRIDDCLCRPADSDRIDPFGASNRYMTRDRGILAAELELTCSTVVVVVVVGFWVEAMATTTTTTITTTFVEITTRSPIQPSTPPGLYALGLGIILTLYLPTCIILLLQLHQNDNGDNNNNNNNKKDNSST